MIVSHALVLKTHIYIYIYIYIHTDLQMCTAKLVRAAASKRGSAQSQDPTGAPERMHHTKTEPTIVKCFNVFFCYTRKSN